MTGGTTSAHVKARLIEAALAGCLVFELAGSPAEQWFTPGQDYVAYTDAADIKRKIDLALANQSDAEAMAFAFREKIKREHSPAIFWGHVIHRLGLGPAPGKLHQPAFRPWRHGEQDVGQPAAPGAQIPLGPPMLVGSKGPHNLVAWHGAVYAVPHAVGSIEIDKADLRRYPTIRKFKSLDDARART